MGTIPSIPSSSLRARPCTQPRLSRRGRAVFMYELTGLCFTCPEITKKKTLKYARLFSIWPPLVRLARLTGAGSGAARQRGSGTARQRDSGAARRHSSGWQRGSTAMCQQISEGGPWPPLVLTGAGSGAARQRGSTAAGQRGSMAARLAAGQHSSVAAGQRGSGAAWQCGSAAGSGAARPARQHSSGAAEAQQRGSTAERQRGSGKGR